MPVDTDFIGDAEDSKKNAGVKAMAVKWADNAMVIFTSLLTLGLGGILYHKLYKERVTRMMLRSFEEEDETSRGLPKKSGAKGPHWVERQEQKFLDTIARGELAGRYVLIIGEKGTGKTSAMNEAIRRVDGKNFAVVDCSSDPELMRLRIGHALNFKFHEDYIGSLFSMRGPRDTTALLDMERAFTELEDVAVRHSKAGGKPLVLVFNNAHLIRNDADGTKLVELLQQKAELFASSGLLTMVFSSDDYWLYEKFKNLATRLEVVSFRDLNREESKKVIKATRLNKFDEKVSDSLCDDVYTMIGGRPQHLNYVASHLNMLDMCKDLIEREKIWYLNKCGLLGEDMDDDVMESGKFSTSAMLLMREFVRMDNEEAKCIDPACSDHHLPELPLWKARQIMTRPDYIERYDNLNIFTIDSYSRVRTDSVPMMKAFHEIAESPGFDKLLDETVDRVSAIESLGRTREVVLKDLVQGGQYDIDYGDGKAVVTLKTDDTGN